MLNEGMPVLDSPVGLPRGHFIGNGFSLAVGGATTWLRFRFLRSHLWEDEDSYLATGRVIGGLRDRAMVAPGR